MTDRQASSVWGEPTISTVRVRVARTIGELAGLPVGTRIATNTNKIYERENAWGKEYWIEEGTLSPFFEPLVSWLPAYILPPVVDYTVEGPG